MAQPIWITSAGSVGTYPAQLPMLLQLVAQPVLPATTVTYLLLSGSLPAGLTLAQTGLISGTPDTTFDDNTFTFVVRVTDNLGNLRDRTFSITISGIASPSFTTLSGTILTTDDSEWIELPIEYNNPVSTNEVSIRVLQGELPPGLEINSSGLIRGYPEAPIVNVNLGLETTSIIAINSNQLTGLSTAGFIEERPIFFTGSVFGGIEGNKVYFIQSVIDEYTFTISTTAGGPVYALSNSTGYMNATLPNISIGQPTIKTYTFTLKLESLLGSDLEQYSITVINQNAAAPTRPARAPNTRVPTLYNTRPPTYDIESDTQYYRYYILPPDSNGYTYAPTSNAYIGRVSSDNKFSFKILGHDFDGNVLNYSFSNLPLGLVGDVNTGWITGNPIIADNSISEFAFSVAAYKATNPAISTPYFNFSFRLSNDIVGDIVWVTPSDLGTIENSSVSILSVSALSDVTLNYRITSGQLPPNLTLSSTGDIVGKVVYIPEAVLLEPGDVSSFTFTVQAFSPVFSVVQSSRTFTVKVSQTYIQPTDTLYIKCTPNVKDRNIIRSLLNNTTLIPSEYLYRPDDPNFGKANDITYVHAYGIFANELEAYITAVTKNHYWRNITLGEIKTAVAKNDQGEVIYEVVYSSVIDNLINPSGISVSKDIYWPRDINLNLGPWYTTVTNLYTSYIGASTEGQLMITNQDYYISTENDFIIETEIGQPTFYTSLTPGTARSVYPNSLPNMREEVGDVLGQEYNFNLYPKWMTSQQSNGSTLGFTPAWVICYTKPGQVTLPNGDKISYAEQIKNNINNNWKDFLGDNIKLNQINFKIDRFTVDKELTYDYDNNLSPPAWLSLPSTTPAPNPTDSDNFYVLFPRKTILPNNTEY